MAGTPAPIPICRCSARCPASSMSMARASGSAIICCPPATRFRNQFLSNVAVRQARVMAGCSPRSGAPRKIAAISRCSTPRMSNQAPSRWCISVIACPTVSTAIGSARRKRSPEETPMHVPSITAIYLALLALLYTVLAVQVGRLRQRDRATFGDNGSLELRSAIRAHANFIEYVPIITLMVAMLEMSGLAAAWVHLLMDALLLSRLLHPLGMSAVPNTLQFRIGRVG